MSAPSSGPGGVRPFCIVIYVELFSHRAPGRRPVVNSQRYTREMFSESPRLRRGRFLFFFSFGGKALRRMDEGEIPDNGNIYKSSRAFIIPPFISKLEKKWGFHGLLSTAVWPVSPLCLLPARSAQAHVVHARVEINFPRLAENGRHASSCSPGRLGRDSSSTPVLTE